MAASEERSDVSDVFTLSDELTKWKDRLRGKKQSALSETEKKAEICSVMGISEAMCEELKGVCGLKSLDCEGETDNEEKRQEVLSSVNLETSRLMLKYAQLEGRRVSDIFEPSFGARHCADDVWVHDLIKEKSQNEKDVKLTPGSEVLLSLQIYKPFRKNGRVVLLQEFHVLGSTELCALRDAISCSSDLAVAGEFSENPSIPQDVIAKDVFKSSFFFFEGTFYDDTRDPDCRKYSEVIMNWVKDSNHRFGPFDRKCMEDAKFCNLKVRLGQPYCYLHQGNCEHMIVITDARLVHADDCLTVSQYPMLVYRKRESHKMCKGCITQQASWVVMESELCPEDPCHLCDTCFRWLHYDENNMKIGQFKAYAYVPK